MVSGPTHQCYEDLTLMRAMPNMAVYSPADHVTAAALITPCRSRSGPKYLRLDAQVLPVLHPTEAPCLESGFHRFRTGQRLCLVATGYMVHTALTVAERLAAKGEAAGVLDLFDLASFAAEQLAAELNGYQGIVTLEEGFRGRGGMDALLFDFCARHALPARILNIGVEGGYRFELGSRSELHEQESIGEQAVYHRITDFIHALDTQGSL